MFDFGDELIVESTRLPWLIWIQLLVTFLLVILLYGLSLYALDLPSINGSGSSSFTAASSSTTRSISDKTHLDKPLPNHNPTTILTNRLQRIQGGEQQSIKGEIATSTSRRIVGGENDTVETGGSSTINAYFHPCNYFRLARLAFLKCLGLESNSEIPIPEQKNSKEQKKRKES